jgi:hypothetical protein
MISGPPTLVNLSNDKKKGLAATIDIENIEKSEAIVLFTNEESLSKSPLAEISLYNNMKVRAILDSGSEVNFLAQSIYDTSIASGADIATSPLENVIAFRKLYNRVKK